MKKFVILLGSIFFLCGCFAIVDDTSGTRTIKGFGISKDETLDMLERVNSKSGAEKKEITFFSRKKND